MSLRQRLLRAVDDIDEIDSTAEIRVKEAVKSVVNEDQQGSHCGYCGCEELVDAGNGLAVCASCGQWYYGQFPVPKDDALDLLDRINTTKCAVEASDSDDLRE
jgi:ribosomal protein L37AE/L43A